MHEALALTGIFLTRLSIWLSAMFLEVVSACCFSKRIPNIYYVFTMTVLYTERRDIPSLSHELSVGSCEVY